MTFETITCPIENVKFYITKMVKDGWEPFLMSGGDSMTVIVFRKVK